MVGIDNTKELWGPSDGGIFYLIFVDDLSLKLSSLLTELIHIDLANHFVQTGSESKQATFQLLLRLIPSVGKSWAVMAWALYRVLPANSS